jgi:competence protein ComGC
MKNRIQQEGNDNVSLIESPINVYNYNKFDVMSELQKLVALGQFEDASKLRKIIFQSIPLC